MMCSHRKLYTPRTWLPALAWLPLRLQRPGAGAGPVRSGSLKPAVPYILSPRTLAGSPPCSVLPSPRAHCTFLVSLSPHTVGSRDVSRGQDENKTETGSQEASMDVRTLA